MTNHLAKKAMLANLNISQWGARRFDREVTDEVNSNHSTDGAARDLGRYNKRLVAKSALEPVWQITNRARVMHQNMTQPWLDNGSRILPAALYLKYAEVMRALEAEFDAAVAKFCEDYPAHVEARKAELTNGMFKADDYPSPATIHRKFDFDVKVFPVPDPDDFRVELAAEHADDIKRDIEESMKEALTVAMQEPVTRIIDVVGRMAERLNAYDNREEGSRTGTFRNTLVENVRELVELLPAFNLTDDPALTNITRRMEQELCVEDAKALRENPQARADVQKSAEDILAHVKQFM